MTDLTALEEAAIGAQKGPWGDDGTYVTDKTGDCIAEVYWADDRSFTAIRAEAERGG